jgi:hypothetical protein
VNGRKSPAQQLPFLMLTIRAESRSMTGLSAGFSSQTRVALLALSFVVLAMGRPAVLHAQQTGDGFLFRRSSGQLLVHGGFAQSRANSRVFDFTIEQLTIDRGDFSSFEGGMELVGFVSPNFAITLGFDYSRSTHRSEFRDWVDNDDLPIEQSTTFMRAPMMLGMKAYLIPNGRSVGVLAWVPSKVAPFVGAGFGLMRYDFTQRGDWVDFQDFSVFTDEFRSMGTSFMNYLSAGADISLNPRFGLTTEIRSIWASGEHTDDFVGFDDIDLSGTTIKAVLFIRFCQRTQPCSGNR